MPIPPLPKGFYNCEEETESLYQKYATETLPITHGTLEDPVYWLTLSLDKIVEFCGDSPIQLLEYMNMARDLENGWEEKKRTLKHAKESGKSAGWVDAMNDALGEVRAALMKNRSAEKYAFSGNGYWGSFLGAYDREYYRLHMEGKPPANLCKAFMEFGFLVEKIAEEHTREFMERVQNHIRTSEQGLTPEERTAIPHIRGVVSQPDGFETCWLLLDKYMRDDSEADIYHSAVGHIASCVDTIVSHFKNEPEQALAWLCEAGKERSWEIYKQEVYNPQIAAAGKDKALTYIINDLSVLQRHINKDPIFFKLFTYGQDKFPSGTPEENYATFTEKVSQIAKEHLEETIRGLEERIATEAMAQDEAQQPPLQDGETEVEPLEEARHTGKLQRKRQEKNGCCRVM